MNNIVYVSGILVRSTYSLYILQLVKDFFVSYYVRFVICPENDKKNLSLMYSQYSITKCQPDMKIVIVYYLVLKRAEKRSFLMYKIKFIEREQNRTAHFLTLYQLTNGNVKSRSLGSKIHDPQGTRDRSEDLHSMRR